MKSDYNAHSNPLFAELKFLKLEYIYRIEVLQFMYQYAHETLPLAINNIYLTTSSIHDHNTRQSTQLRTCHPRTNLSANSILCKGPTLWNKLSYTIQDLVNLNILKRTLINETLVSYLAT